LALIFRIDLAHRLGKQGRNISDRLSQPLSTRRQSSAQPEAGRCSRHNQIPNSDLVRPALAALRSLRDLWGYVHRVLVGQGVGHHLRVTFVPRVGRADSVLIGLAPAPCVEPFRRHTSGARNRAERHRMIARPSESVAVAVARMALVRAKALQASFCAANGSNGAAGDAGCSRVSGGAIFAGAICSPAIGVYVVSVWVIDLRACFPPVLRKFNRRSCCPPLIFERPACVLIELSGANLAARVHHFPPWLKPG
jgi:hypothetical protein